MARDTANWVEFYRKMQGRAPRPVLLAALERFATMPPPRARRAIDLGCGDGTETAALLERGWQVLATDQQPAAISRLLAKVPTVHHARLQTHVAPFELVALPPADLILACFSLPFCTPEHFGSLWGQIVRSIVPGGRFAGQFFGVRDSWADQPDMTFHTAEQVHALFEGFEVESFDEQEEDGHAASGPKHWHVFTVVAKQR